MPPRLIGMIHLLPLPGAPGARPLEEVQQAALRDAQALADAGFDGLGIENFGDAPFFPDRVEPVTTACMAAICARLRDRVRLPLMVNVLRNDAQAALAVAVAVAAEAIRVNVLAGARLTDQGVVQGRAAELLRCRAAWGQAQIWADVQVKHSAALGVPRPLAEEVEELAGRAGADAVIVSGAATGAPVDLDRLRVARAACPRSLFVGSGATVDTVRALLDLADGVIVGTALKVGGRTTAPVDPAAARALVRAAG